MRTQGQREKTSRVLESINYKSLHESSTSGHLELYPLERCVVYLASLVLPQSSSLKFPVYGKDNDPTEISFSSTVVGVKDRRE